VLKLRQKGSPGLEKVRAPNDNLIHSFIAIYLSLRSDMDTILNLINE